MEDMEKAGATLVAYTVHVGQCKGQYVCPDPYFEEGYYS